MLPGLRLPFSVGDARNPTTLFRRSTLIALIGGCLVLAASSSTALSWVHALSPVMEATPLSWSGYGAFALLGIGMVLMFLGYFRGLHAARQEQITLVHVLGATVLLAIPMVILITLPSTDLYSYAIYARIDAFYDANPYTQQAREFPGDQPPLANDRLTVSVYGPVWQILARTLASVAGEDAGPVFYIFSFRLMGLLMLLLGATVIWLILDHVAPGKQAYGSWLYAANPLCLFELVGSGHNDGLMVLLILVALLAHVRGRTACTVVCLGLAILTKWIPVILIPAYLVWVYSGRASKWQITRQLLIGAVIVIISGAGLYGKDWSGLQTFTAVTNNRATNKMTNSLAAWMAYRLIREEEPLPGPDRSSLAHSQPGEELPNSGLNDTERRVKRGVTLAFVIWALALLALARRRENLPTIWGWTLFAYLCLASVWFWPWYVVWIIALAALVPGTLLAEATLVFSATAVLNTVGLAASYAYGLKIGVFVVLTCLVPLSYAVCTYLFRRLGKRI